MSQGYESAPQATAFKPADQVGNGVLIAIHGYEQGIATTFGTKDAVRADIVVVSGSDAGSRYVDTLVFGMKLVGQLKGSIGKTVIGRIGKGAPKPGQQAPYQLDTAGDADMKAADAWIAENGPLTATLPTLDAAPAVQEAPAPKAKAAPKASAAPKGGSTYTDDSEPPF